MTKHLPIIVAALILAALSFLVGRESADEPKRWTKALTLEHSHASSAIRYEPSARNYFYRGFLAYLAGDMELAEPDLQTAIKLNPQLKANLFDLKTDMRTIGTWVFEPYADAAPANAPEKGRGTN